MSKLFSQIKEKELLTLEFISRTDGKALQEKLSEEEFNQLYFIDNPKHELPVYYKRIYKDVSENEIDTFLLYKLLKEQRKTRKNINIIKNIIVGFVVTSLVVAVIVLINLFG